MNVHLKNLSDTDLMLMIVHYPHLLNLITVNLPFILISAQYMRNKEGGQDEAPGMIDAEAQKPEKPKRTGWIFRRKPKE